MSKNRNNSLISCTVVCPKKSRVINEKNTNRKLNNEFSKGFECKVCKKLLDRKSSLVLHERTHLDDRPLTCKVCQKTFLDKSLLNKHLITECHAKCTERDKGLCTEKYRRLINEYKPEISSDYLYKCFICYKTFKEEWALKDHLQLHVGNCSKSFIQSKKNSTECKTPVTTTAPKCIPQGKINAFLEKSCFELKFNSVKNTIGGNKCQEYLKTGVSLSELSCLSEEDSKHALSDKLSFKDAGKSFECEICQKVFKFESLLSEHVCTEMQLFNSEIAEVKTKTYQKNTDKPIHNTSSRTKFRCLKRKSFVCHKCQEVFENKSSLTLHFCTLQNKTLMKTYNRASTASNLDVSNKIEEQKSSVNGDQSLDMQLFICSICKQHFHKEETLTFHLRCHIEAKFVCEDCQTIFDTRKLFETHRRSISRKQFQCNVCQKVFCCEKNLINHNEIHNRKDEFPCNLCDRLFKNKFILNVHYFSHTKNVPFFICPVCLEIFSNRNNWVSHCCTHMGIKPHICKICKKYFVKKRNFYLHCRIHTDEVPYNCETCHKTFKYHNTLVMHRHNHIRGNV